ncbi:MAG: TIM barrel protein, partial [Armatimonadota bacterium]
MRLGGPVFEAYDDPDCWARAVRALGYSAAYCPIKSTASEETAASFVAAAAEHDVVIAEVAAWCNPLSPNESERKAAVEFCKRQLDFAERIGASCCVGVSGSRGEKWEPVPAVVESWLVARLFYAALPSWSI